MKLTEINIIIEQTLTEEVKNRILIEQEEKTRFIDIIKNLPSLSPLMDKISDITNVGEDNVVHINDINVQDFLSCCDTDDLSTALDKIYKDVSKEIGKLGAEGNFDVEVAYDNNDNDNLDIKIKITSSEPLGSEKNNDMENTQVQEFVECLTKAKNKDEKKFNVQGKEYDVDEWYSKLDVGLRESEEVGEEVEGEVSEEEDCDECGDEVAEVDITEQEPMGNDPGQEYFNKVLSQFKQENVESELAGRNGGIEDTTSNYASSNELVEKKKTLRLSEEKFINLITRIITEALKKPQVVGKDPKVDTITKPFKDATKIKIPNTETVSPKNVPGLEAVKKAHDKEESEEKTHFNDVDKKLKDYLSFDGNNNPEFPNQISEVDDEIVANRDGDFGEDSQEYIDTYRGMGIQDSAYDTPPPEDFVERVKIALMGDTTMGNASGKDTANTTESDVGEKVFKNISKKREALDKDPMYVKDEQPVEDDEEQKKEIHNPGFETLKEEEQENVVVNEDIERMKTLSSYNKKTQ